MKAITSRDNPLYKRLKALAGSTHQQRRSGQALLEGFHLASAWLDGGAQPELCVVTDGALAHDEAQTIVARIDGQRVVMLPDALFGQLSNVVHGVGLLLLVDTPEPALPPRVADTCVVLDGVQDAGNVGSILRSAAAAGIDKVFCTPGTAHAWSSKVLRSAMGAHFLLNVFENVEPAALLDSLAAPVVITDSHGAQPVDDCDLTGAVAWVFGNEGAGVSQVWRDAAAHRVTIPQPGGMESLNVAAAAAVCLFEQVRQQRRAR
ncbi:TrmH family RNA methyltransferase [Paraburkholderia caballeronis]|uniref:RNA methyltransferase, TrmH family n=1 Tax=Paraburkholderia caballeronis TaxID=416943 RepID=A0A1H7NF53_9BURK|nr:RNA methyltransferase [Paraburkholderia caballeronis]PXW26148.1 TrmH family RNA methyltransferase [Paraburkholderia caballeronis]PXX01695.1 TrmH family RNA methyltransferase [Paraburkholderia caballeronis]RAK00852.1 TrmH family RNA methyltransferase [Paraburkholderia caballeronis]SEC11776.1 RNA methyltransferase, TrmH family [Paraburkholderia caballeronis]SEL21537.1 RNA methyltransferase, TrmH family [Paraburkholderia caballeronis]